MFFLKNNKKEYKLFTLYNKKKSLKTKTHYTGFCHIKSVNSLSVLTTPSKTIDI